MNWIGIFILQTGTSGNTFIVYKSRQNRIFTKCNNNEQYHL